jgi:hypothetical protein
MNGLDAKRPVGWGAFFVANHLVRGLPLLSPVRQSPTARIARFTADRIFPPMLFGIIGRTTNANDLKDALDLSSQRTRAIASRVAQASLNNSNGFALPIDPATGKPTESNQVDLEAEMTGLADEQVRYEATEKLLEKMYAQLRTSMK